MIRFRSEIVHSSANVEVAFHSPAGTVGVADDPVFHLQLLVVTVTDDEDGVVNLQPFKLVLFPRVVGQLISLLVLNSLGLFGSSQDTHAEVVIISQYTTLERLEFLSSFEVHDDGAVGSKFSNNHLFSRSSVEATEILNVSHLGDLRAVGVGRASLFEGDLVRSTFLRSSVERLKEMSTKNTPASIAAFGKPVTGQRELRGQVYSLTVFDTDVRLHHADSRDLEARPTASLVRNFTSKVNSIEISPTEILRHRLKVDLFRVAKVLLSLLKLLFSGSEARGRASLSEI